MSRHPLTSHNCHIGLLVLAAFFITGCTRTAPPSLALRDVILVDQGSDASVVEFSFDISNPNVEGVPLRDFEYQAAIDGKPLEPVRRAAEATVRRLGTQIVAIPIVIPYSVTQGRPSGTHRITVVGELSYIAPSALGEMLFDTGVRVPTMSFEETVELTFPESDDDR